MLLKLRKLAYLTLGKTFSLPSKVVVFCYHSIASDNWRFSIDFSVFKKQMQFLVNHFRPITVEDLYLHLSGEKILTEAPFLLTFDDGYKDILVTKDFLKSLNIKPVVFVLANPNSANKQELETTREFLTTQDILETGWEVGCHSATHANFSLLTNEELNKEIIEAKKYLEKNLGKEVKYFAYPKGVYNEKVLEAVKFAGFKLAFSMDEGYINIKTNPLVLPRVGVDRTHSFEEFKVLATAPAMWIRKLGKKFLSAQSL